MSEKPNPLKTLGRILILLVLLALVLFVFLIIIVRSSGGLWYKPIIYLYPETETNVSVKLENNDYITVSYPEYDDGWIVTAAPDGTLTDLETGREFYSLYYEADNPDKFIVNDYGFVVKKDNLISFLEEKLSLLGLTEREANEFIIYWLPILQENEYNYIRFAEQTEIESKMPLDIEPEPDTVIRVLMLYKNVENPIKVKEQKIVTPERIGFTVVEWGGVKLD